MNGTVLDILLYVFDRYMFDEAPEVPEREASARDLESAGTRRSQCGARWTGWRISPASAIARRCCLLRQNPSMARRASAVRCGFIHQQNSTRLSADCRGLLLSLEEADILNPAQRELVIDRLAGAGCGGPQPRTGTLDRADGSLQVNLARK